jgi:FixJ family two-component response regulator
MEIQEKWKHHCRSELIFVVDDDYDVRQSLTFFLEVEGFQVLAFPNAKKLLNFNECGNAECFIIDYKMQPIDGIELAESLRHIGIKAPIILITGFPDMRIEAKAKAVGVSTVLLKPHLEDSVVRSLREVLAAKESL